MTPDKALSSPSISLYHSPTEHFNTQEGGRDTLWVTRNRLQGTAVSVWLGFHLLTRPPGTQADPGLYAIERGPDLRILLSEPCRHTATSLWLMALALEDKSSLLGTRCRECSNWHPLAQGLGYHSCGTPSSSVCPGSSPSELPPRSVLRPPCLWRLLSAASCLKLAFCLQPTGDIPGEPLPATLRYLIWFGQCALGRHPF